MPALRVMTYNVRYFAHPTRGLASTVSGIRAIAKGLAALEPRPDVVCLQEVETRSLRSSVASGPTADVPQLDRLMEALHVALRERGAKTTYDAYYFPAHTYRLGRVANIYTTGLAVLAKSRIKVLAHNADGPHDITHRTRLVRLKQTRIAAHVAFEHPSGARIEIFNTHLSLPSFFKPEFWTGKARLGYGKNQLEEAKQLASFIERQRQTDHYLVCGDFNSLPGSPVDELLRGRGLTEARRVVAGQRPGDAGTEGFSTAGFMNLRMHIDHLYGSPSIEWLDMADTHGFDGAGLFNGLSDHVPLIARFRLGS
jgi:endonuclease/exonuclease/phosphatase family metal-dependent hydrolase